MGDRQPLRIGHLKLLDHLILGVTAGRNSSGAHVLRNSFVEPVAMNAWDQVFTALTEASIDGALIPVPAAIKLWSSGAEYRLVLLSNRGGSLIVGNGSVPVRRLSDFSNRVVMLPHRLSMHHILVHRLLTHSGLKVGWTGDGKADVILDAMPPEIMPEALALDDTGEMAAIAVSQPFAGAAMEGGGRFLFSTAALWPDHPCCGLVLSDEVISKRSRAVQELVHGLMVSGREIHDDKTHVLDSAERFLGREMNDLVSMLADKNTGYSSRGLIPETEELETIQKYMIEHLKLLSRPVAIDRWVDLTFARNAGD